MLEKGPAKKVTIYINEDAKYHHAPLHEALMRYLYNQKISGATLTRAIAGFGSHHVLHTANLEARAEHLPLRIEFIEAPDRIDVLLPSLYEMVGDGLIEVQDTTVVRAASTAVTPAPEPRPVRRRTAGPARMLRVYLGEADRCAGEPLYEAIIKRLRMLDIAGATVYRGIHGYGAKGHTHKQDFFHLSRDLPIMLSVVDTQEKIEKAAHAIEDMMGDGLIVMSDVEMIRLEGGDFKSVTEP